MQLLRTNIYDAIELSLDDQASREERQTILAGCHGSMHPIGNVVLR
jgi:hypothetical protein